MGAGRDTIPLPGRATGTSRYLIAGAALCLVALAVAVALATGLIGSGGASSPRAPATGRALRISSGSAASAGQAELRSRRGQAPANTQASGSSAAKAGPVASATVASGAVAAGHEHQVAEVRDPEESRSYPAPASVKHSAARAPSSAAEAIIAPGAASTAEIRAELAKMHAAENATREQTLKPVPGGESIGGNGTIPIPTNVPEVVQRVIAGANAIADFPYRYGGGHVSFIDNAYDCSGSVSYALAAGGLLSAPETSGELESWGAPGPGRYITVYANAGHTYMYVDGMLYDTAGRSGVLASRWQVYPTDNSGYVVRHWPGL